MNLAFEKYIKVRKAQAEGAETEEELKEIEALIKNACKCKNVSIETIVQAVRNGNDTIEKVVEATKAGSACGKCKGIITNIIENKR